MRGVAAKRWNTVETNTLGLNTIEQHKPPVPFLGYHCITVSLHGHVHGCTDPEIMHDYR
jgi:hypothetical protein